MPDDQKFDDFLRRSAAGYKADVPVPADDLWRGIENDVRTAISGSAIGDWRADDRRSAIPSRLRAKRQWLYACAGLAAALLLGIGIGRWSNAGVRIGVRQPVRIAQRDDSVRRAAHLRATAYDHLAETEVFLTEVRADLRSGRSDAERAERSRELLSRTRLLLQRRDAQSADVNRLLEDLELLLAEIATLPAAPAARTSVDAALVEESLAHNNIIPRIRTTLPARAAGI